MMKESRETDGAGSAGRFTMGKQVAFEIFLVDKVNPVSTYVMAPSEAHEWAWKMVKHHGKGDLRVWNPDEITYYWDESGYEIRVHAPLP